MSNEAKKRTLARLSRWEKRKAEIFAALKADGATEAEVEYSGEGDEGTVHDVESDGNLSRTTEAMIEDFCYDYLKDTYDLWQDCEGSRGKFTFKVKIKKVKHLHEVPVTEYQGEEVTI